MKINDAYWATLKESDKKGTSEVTRTQQLHMRVYIVKIMNE